MIVHRRGDATIQYFEDRDLRLLMDTTGIGLGRVSLAEETLAPGQYIPAHWHADLEEVYHVKVGQGTMRVGAEEETVRAGDTVLIPTRTVHSLHNASDAPLILLCVVSPPWRADDHYLVD